MDLNSKMTALADAIRAKTNRTDTLSIDEMTVAVEGIEIESYSTIYIGASEPTSDIGFDGDIYIVRGE